VTINERIGARPTRAASPDTVSRAAWQREQAEREPTWALAPARAEGSRSALRPGDDWPDTANVAAGLARVAAVLNRIASDAGALARARRAGELTIAAVLPGPRAERRRRLAEPDLDVRTFCRTKQMPGSTPARMERAWMRGRPSGTDAGRPGSSPPAPPPIPRALTTPVRTLKRSIVVQKPGRCSGADGSVVTGTPLPHDTNEINAASRSTSHFRNRP